MSGPLFVALLAVTAGVTLAGDSLVWRETPIVCRIKCGAFFHAENSFFFTDCLMREFEGKCVHMPQPWVIYVLVLAAIAIPLILIYGAIRLCVDCFECLRKKQYVRV